MLQAFYAGSDPLAWLQIPLKWLRAYIDQLPRLQAQQSMQRVTEIAIGTGNMEKRDKERILRQWERQIHIVREKQTPSREQRALVLATMGIPMVEFKPDEVLVSGHS